MQVGRKCLAGAHVIDVSANFYRLRQAPDLSSPKAQSLRLRDNGDGRLKAPEAWASPAGWTWTSCSSKSAQSAAWTSDPDRRQAVLAAPWQQCSGRSVAPVRRRSAQPPADTPVGHPGRAGRSRDLADQPRSEPSCRADLLPERRVHFCDRNAVQASSSQASCWAAVRKRLWWAAKPQDSAMVGNDESRVGATDEEFKLDGSRPHRGSCRAKTGARRLSFFVVANREGSMRASGLTWRLAQFGDEAVTKCAANLDRKHAERMACTPCKP